MNNFNQITDTEFYVNVAPQASKFKIPEKGQMFIYNNIAYVIEKVEPVGNDPKLGSKVTARKLAKE